MRLPRLPASRLSDEALPERVREAPILLASDSLVQGFGNENSDIDVIVIDDRAPDVDLVDGDENRAFMQRSGTVVNVGYIDRWCLDAETVSWRVVSELADQLRSHALQLEFTLTWSNDLFTTMNNINARISLRGRKEFADLKASFPWAAWCALLAKRSEGLSRGQAEDAAGAIMAGDHRTAFLTSSGALGAAVDALTAVLGSSKSKSKWCFRKLGSLDEYEVLHRYWVLSTEPDSSRAAVLERSKKRLLAAQDLLMRVGETLGSELL